MIAGDELCDEDIAEIGLVLVEALEHAHARGVIHRDVKPQNVLVPSRRKTTPVSRRRLGRRRRSSPTSVARDSRATTRSRRTGDVLGTLAYMAPEQSEGHEAGPPADLYSLALVLYEAFRG